jgi:DNA invertase Pin-like site-specific DNA recombinase
VLNIVRWKLEDKEVVFINDNIDTSTAQWRLFLTQLSGFAEFERELIVSRIKDWLEEAKKQWKTLWRPVSKEKSIKNLVDRIRSYRKWRKSWEEIAKLLNYKSRSTPYKIFMKYKKIYI